MNSALSVGHPLKRSDATETTDAAPAHVDARAIAADKYLAAAKPVKQ